MIKNNQERKIEVRPFLKWAGGKSWLCQQLGGKIPKYKVYFEPFLGSAALFFLLKPKEAILSDMNRDLINCYLNIRDKHKDIIKIISALRVNREFYYRVRERYNHEADGVKKAAYFLYLNKTCWNGLYRVNSVGKFNVPVGRLKESGSIVDTENLHAASKLLRNTTIWCCDFEKAVKKAHKNDFVYFDPPYVTSHLKNGFIKYNSKLFSEFDEKRLARLVEKLDSRNVNVLVSNASHPAIRRLYRSTLKKRDFTRKSLIAADSEKRKDFRELLISNFTV